MRPANISAGNAGQYYYEKDPAYENELKLHGKGAEALGLKGGITKEQFEKLINGKDPNGKWEIKAGGENQEHRAGIDIPFTVSKSESIIALHLDNENLKNIVEGAHAKAVDQTMNWMQKEGYFAYRETKNGVTEIKAGQGMYMKFNHSESRAGDPNKHTHVLMLNAVRTETGEMRALCGDKIFNDQKLITTVYNSYRAAEITNAGLAIETKASGHFEVAGSNKQQIEQFSKRSQNIEELKKELPEKFPNATPGQLQNIAALYERQLKDKEHTGADSKKNWTEQDKAAGIDKQETEKNVQAAGEKAKEFQAGGDPKLTTHDYVSKAVAATTERESTFTKSEIIRTAAIFSMGQKTPDELGKAFDEAVKDKDIKNLGQGVIRNGNGAEQKVLVYSSKEMIKIEKDILHTAKDGQGKAEPIMSKEDAQKALTDWQDKVRVETGDKDFKLTNDQYAAAEHILTSPDKVVLIQGDAGTSKTTMLKAVNDISTEQGYKIKGLAATGKAVGQIEKSSGIDSQTAARFIAARETTSGNSITILDKTSMLGSKATAEVLKATVNKNDPYCRIVMIADVKQLPSIAAGKTHQDLQEKSGLPVIEMKENIRQTNEGAKDIANAMSEKDFEKAFAKMEEQGRIKEIPNKDERHAAIAKDYVKDTVAGKETILTTATNADRHDLNNRIHEGLQAEGKIGQDNYTFITRESKNLDPIQKEFASSYEKGDDMKCSCGVHWAYLPRTFEKCGVNRQTTNFFYGSRFLTCSGKSGTGSHLRQEIGDAKQYEPVHDFPSPFLS